MTRKKLTPEEKRIHTEYYEDQDVLAHIKSQPNYKGSKWIRTATRALYNKDRKLLTGKSRQG